MIFMRVGRISNPNWPNLRGSNDEDKFFLKCDLATELYFHGAAKPILRDHVSRIFVQELFGVVGQYPLPFR